MINVIGAKNYINYFSKLREQNYSSSLNFLGAQNTLKAPKLSPLKQDTISFTGIEPYNPDLDSAIHNHEQCREVYRNSRLASRDFSRVLRNAMRPYVYDEKENPKGFIYPVKVRRKSAESIREKTVSRFETALKGDVELFNPRKVLDIKRTVGDTIGGRIVLMRTHDPRNQRVIDALIKEVEKGNLKIIGIESYIPKGYKGESVYFKKQDLERLEKAVNSAPNREGEPIKYKVTETDTGYASLHLDVKLSNPNYKSKDNHYRGEIQILDKGTEQLKDVEDFCYKVKQDKKIRGGDKAYVPFESYFRDYANTDAMIDAFTLYTSRAYEIQRENRTPSNILPSVSECEMDGFVNQELDFNTLAKIKSHCDSLYKIMHHQDV